MRDQICRWHRAAILLTLVGLSVVAACGCSRRAAVRPSGHAMTPSGTRDVDVPRSATGAPPDPVLEWNQIFIDSLIATKTPNSSSPRLGAIVQLAVFDAYVGIERRYAPILVRRTAPRGASRRAAVIAAAYTVLVGLFPSRQAMLDTLYAASLAALADDGEDGGRSRELGVAWGREVAQAVLAWRATDGSGADHPSFVGGTAVGQWRPTPPRLGPMSAHSLAFTSPFVVNSETQFRPDPPRSLLVDTYTADVRTVATLGRNTGSTRTEDQTALALFWEGNASVHWNQAANQMAHANRLSTSDTSRLLAALNIAMADTAITVWSAKRFYGSVPTHPTWRPVTAIKLADADGNPETTSDPEWLPLIDTPSHPEYPAGHPSLNGAAATILLRVFEGRTQTFLLTTAGHPSRSYKSIVEARSDGNRARVWGGMHYPSTVRISDAVGEALARYVDRNAMKPVH
jgi:hypothetical protein